MTENVGSELTDGEVLELGEILRKVASKEKPASYKEYIQRLSDMRVQTQYILRKALNRCRSLREYREAVYEPDGNRVLVWPGSRSSKAVGFGWTGHASAAAKYFYETYKDWGFKDIAEFYSLPKNTRDEFIDQAVLYCESLLGENTWGLERLLNEVEDTEDLTEMKLLQLKAEDIEREVKAAFAQIAGKLKSRAEELDQRNRGRRI